MLLHNMDLCPPSPDSCPGSPDAILDSPPSSPMTHRTPYSCAGTIYEPLLSPLLPWTSPPIETSPAPCPKPLPSLQAELEALVSLGDAAELDSFLKENRGRGVCLDFLCPRTGMAPLHRACVSTTGWRWDGCCCSTGRLPPSPPPRAGRPSTSPPLLATPAYSCFSWLLQKQSLCDSDLHLFLCCLT